MIACRFPITDRMRVCMRFCVDALFLPVRNSLYLDQTGQSTPESGGNYRKFSLVLMSQN